MKKTLFLVATALMFIGCAPKMETTGIITHDSGADDSTSIAALRKMAATDPAAAYDLGLRYLRGDEVPRDPYKGVESLRAAADNGNLRAQSALGRIYLSGLEEMGPDPMEAAKWLQLASERGDREAATLLKKAQQERKKDLDDYEARRRWYGFDYGWYWHSPYYYWWRDGEWIAP